MKTYDKRGVTIRTKYVKGYKKPKKETEQYTKHLPLTKVKPINKFLTGESHGIFIS